MNLVPIGPPGSGKGTQAKMLAEKLSISHISTGEIFRDNMKRQTELGIQITEIMKTGQLVSDEITDQIVRNRLAQPDCANGFILDGYPRNLHQAEALDTMAKLDKVINIQVSETEIARRLSSRRSCPSCNRIFNKVFNPPKVEGKCDFCATELIIRNDDTPEVIADRLRVYNEQTKPILDYYNNKGIVIDINGEIGAENVFVEILSKLGVNEQISAPESR